MSPVTVRRFDRSEAEHVLPVRNAVIPHQRSSLDRFVVRMEVPGRTDLLAEVDGEVVGVGAVEPDRWDPTSCHAWALFGTAVPHRGRGIGTALYRALSGLAREAGLAGMSTAVAEDDAASAAFLRSRGFVEGGRTRYGVLSLAEVRDVDVDPPPGIAIVPLAEANVERAWAAAREAERDVPSPSGLGAAPLPDLDEWRRRTLTGTSPGYAHSFVAQHGDLVVGYAILITGTTDLGWHRMTAVVPEWRSRGVARALKLAQIGSARRAGLRELAALNSERNAPVVRLNERLGHRAQPAIVQLLGPLATP